MGLRVRASVPKQKFFHSTNSMTDSWVICTKLCSTKSPVYGLVLDGNSNIYFTTLDRNIWSINNIAPNQQPTVVKQKKDSVFTGMVYDDFFDVIYICDRCLKDQKVVSYSIQTKTISTVVGKNAPHYQDGKFDDARFFLPSGAAIHKGDLYVSDLHHIRKIDLELRTVETIAGCQSGWNGDYLDGPALQAKFYGPCRLAISEDGIFYFTDNENHCIRKLENGIASTVTGKPNNTEPRRTDGTLEEVTFCFPYGIVLINDHTLLVTDDCGLRKINMRNSTVKTSLVFKGTPLWSLAQDKEGNIYVATNHHEIWKLESSWKYEKMLWLGHLKEEPSNCNLAKLPRDLIVEIAQRVRGVRNFPFHGH